MKTTAPQLPVAIFGADGRQTTTELIPDPRHGFCESFNRRFGPFHAEPIDATADALAALRRTVDLLDLVDQHGWPGCSSIDARQTRELVDTALLKLDSGKAVPA